MIVLRDASGFDVLLTVTCEEITDLHRWSPTREGPVFPLWVEDGGCYCQSRSMCLC
jgi:hypothetical protein